MLRTMVINPEYLGKVEEELIRYIIFVLCMHIFVVVETDNE